MKIGAGLLNVTPYEAAQKPSPPMQNKIECRIFSRLPLGPLTCECFSRCTSPTICYRRDGSFQQKKERMRSEKSMRTQSAQRRYAMSAYARRRVDGGVRHDHTYCTETIGVAGGPKVPSAE